MFFLMGIDGVLDGARQRAGTPNNSLGTLSWVKNASRIIRATSEGGNPQYAPTPAPTPLVPLLVLGGGALLVGYAVYRRRRAGRSTAA